MVSLWADPADTYQALWGRELTRMTRSNNGRGTSGTDPPDLFQLFPGHVLDLERDREPQSARSWGRLRGDSTTRRSHGAAPGNLANSERMFKGTTSERAV